MRYFWIALTAATLASCAMAPAFAKAAGVAYEFKVEQVIDGDTFRGTVEIWPLLTIKATIRLRGVDTPETHRTAPECSAVEAGKGEKATALAATALANAAKVIISNIDEDKYGGRMLADVALVDTAGREVQLAALLIHAGLARRYDGGAKKSWCK